MTEPCLSVLDIIPVIGQLSPSVNCPLSLEWHVWSVAMAAYGYIWNQGRILLLMLSESIGLLLICDCYGYTGKCTVSVRIERFNSQLVGNKSTVSRGVMTDYLIQVLANFHILPTINLWIHPLWLILIKLRTFKVFQAYNLPNTVAQTFQYIPVNV